MKTPFAIKPHTCPNRNNFIGEDVHVWNVLQDLYFRIVLMEMVVLNLSEKNNKSTVFESWIGKE